MTDPTRPQPVVKEFDIQGAVSGLIVSVGSIVFIVRAGITTGNLATLGTLGGTVASILAGAALWYSHRKAGQAAAAQVTPLDSPQGYGGQPLLTADQWANRYGKHSKPAETPAVQQEWDDASLAEIKGPSTRPQPFPREATVTFADRPLGRIVNHDPRSLRYLVPEAETVQSVMWDRKIPILDQGNLGSCTGNATVGVLGSEPFFDTLAPSVRSLLDESEAVKVYSLATQLDGVAGVYPPDDTGSSGLGAAKAAQKLGFISGYQHITSVAAAHTAIQSGPFIVGTDWLTGMDNPDADGRVHATGSVRGGHEYECIGYDATGDLWWFCNSWGPSFGKDGRFCYSSADFAKLLASQGDGTVFVPITQPAPTPTPTPTPAVTFPPEVIAWAKRVVITPWHSHRDRQAAQELLDLAGVK